MSRIHAQVTERITAAQLGDLYNRLKDAVSDVRADIEITTLYLTMSEAGEASGHDMGQDTR